jgi:hypothetical protein
VIGGPLDSSPPLSTEKLRPSPQDWYIVLRGVFLQYFEHGTALLNLENLPDSRVTYLITFILITM